MTTPATAPSVATARPGAAVAMCNYNGGRYLGLQMESIAGQTELPRCIVVVDDGSTDGSWEWLQDWAARAPCKVLLQRNERNLGVTRNFEKAARLAMARAEIVFFADHDDVWFPHKVATFLDAFERDPDLLLAHSDAQLVDNRGQPLPMSLFTALLVQPRERAHVAAGEAWKAYARRNLVTGAACACRSSLLELALPFSERWVHDAWISFTAALAGRVAMIDEPTMAYRLHGENTIGLPIPDWRWRLRAVWTALAKPQGGYEAARLARLEEMHAHGLALGAPADALACLQAAIRHARHRSTLAGRFFQRARAVLAERSAGQYNAWSSGELSVLHDLLRAD